MTEETAGSRTPATTTGAGPVPPGAAEPATSTPPTPTGDTPAGETPDAAPPPQVAGGADTPPPPGDAGPPPPPPGFGGPPPGAVPPPPGGYAGAAFPLRHGLVRPRQGRYLAGVCAAIGRATNTDPVLWRVLLAVLGFFGGIGILAYLVLWLITPAEGDSASPVEALLGRGRSSTSPVIVIVLGMLVALVFGLIVTDGFRAALLGAVVLIGGALLLNRNTEARAAGGSPPTGPFYGPQPAPTPGFAPSSGAAPAAPPTPMAYAPIDRPAEPAATGPYPPQPAPMPPYPGFPAGAETTVPLTTAPAPAVAPAYRAEQAPPMPPVAPPPVNPAGYRPPFAPRGPYAGGGPPTVPIPPAPPAPPPPPPKPPKERSRLGAATFSLVFIALGVVAALDLADVFEFGPSTYFAAALVVVAFGLLVGAWFGRARWLIALGLVLCAALGIATAAESWSRGDNVGQDIAWTPRNVDEVAVRYENNFGDAVLDLSQVDFTDESRHITVEVNFGSIEVILPPEVDVTARVDVSAGEADVLGDSWNGLDSPNNAVTDTGPDGAGGGQLDLRVEVNAGNAEVHR